MKKTLMLILVVALAFSCFAAVLTAGASTTIAQGAKTDGKNYFKVAPIGVRNLTFEDKDVATGISAEGISGAYLVGENGGTFDIISDGAISGNRSLKVTNTGYDYATKLLYVNHFGNQIVAGDTYRLSYSVKTNGATLISTEVFYKESNDASDFLADFRYAITNDENGNPVSVAKVTDGWTGADQKYTNGSCVIGEDGIIRVSFDFTVAADYVVSDDSPCAKLQGANVTGGTATYIYDDICIINTKDLPKYFTVDWDFDYNGLTEAGQAWESQPIWANSGELDADWIDGTKCLKVIAGAGINNAQIGGFDQSAANLEGKKAVKHAALTYFQYDISVENCSMVNIWTLGYYTSVVFNGSEWHSEGNVTGFKVETLENGYRLSYFIDMTENRDLDFNINATTTDGGAVYFDNFVIAHEDYTAYMASEASYNYIDTEDVSVDFDAKGKEIESVKLNNLLISEGDYTIADGKLTIKAEKFANSKLGKEYTLEVVTSAGETAVTARITQNDNRTAANVSYEGEALAAVTYSGTTTYDGTINLTVGGIASGDDVAAIGTASLADKNAGANKVVVSNIQLTGADADKYRLANDTVEIDITVNPLQLTIGAATIADKTYDGTTDAIVTPGTLTNLADGDNVTVTAVGVFNSKDVDAANKVSVSYTIAGDDIANYIAPVAEEVAKTISKANVTVTANAATKQEGDSDPELTYTVKGLVGSDTLQGTLARAEGEIAGEYDITVGTLANDNYNITFNGAKLTVTAKGGADDNNENKGCFGVVGTTSVVALVLAAAAAVVATKRRNK